MKIGLDIHGVIDTHPFFKEMAGAMTATGHEVHIITGASYQKAIRDLDNVGMTQGMHYHTIFSITEYLIEKGVKVEWKSDSNPMFPDDEWDRAKSEYCAVQKIDMHFDDSTTYGNHFSTPYATIKS